MKKQKLGLQELTESENKFQYLLSLKQITYDDLDILTLSEKDQFSDIMTNNVNELIDIERDDFLKKIALIINKSAKNEIWENNHGLITNTIAKLMQDYGSMPTKSDLAEKTGLSRQTINKHLKEYKFHPQYLLQVEQFSLVNTKVLAAVFKFAMNGDIKAARLYFEMVGCKTIRNHTYSTVIEQQNNYVQINGTILSQASVKHLNQDQLEQIERILKISSIEDIKIK